MNSQRPSSNALVLSILLLLVIPLAACTEARPGPQAWIDAPRDGSTLPVGGPVTVIAHAYAEGGVTELLFSVNGAPYQRIPPEQPGASFTEVALEWLPEEPGEYTLGVTTYDAAGQASSPAVITVLVGHPVAQISTPVLPTTTPPTVTPSAVTSVPPPTSAPPPTAPPPATPTEPPPEATVNFWADAATVPAGSCTIVHWETANVQAAFFDDQGVPGVGTFQTCPCATEVHTLKVLLADGSSQVRTITIEVSGSCASPTPPPDTTPPPVPEPFVPADGLEVSCRTTQVLNWLPVNDPSGVHYYVTLEYQVAADQWEEVDQWGPLDDKQVEADVDCGIYYRWAVRAQDGAGNTSEWSEWYHFSISLN